VARYIREGFEMSAESFSLRVEVKVVLLSMRCDTFVAIIGVAGDPPLFKWSWLSLCTSSSLNPFVFSLDRFDAIITATELSYMK
jgi:hypothetical protein